VAPPETRADCRCDSIANPPELLRPLLHGWTGLSEVVNRPAPSGNGGPKQHPNDHRQLDGPQDAPLRRFSYAWLPPVIPSPSCPLRASAGVCEGGPETHYEVCLRGARGPPVTGAGRFTWDRPRQKTDMHLPHKKLPESCGTQLQGKLKASPSPHQPWTDRISQYQVPAELRRAVFMQRCNAPVSLRHS